MIDVGDEALDLLDIKEVAKRLRLSQPTVRRLIASDRLGAVREGRRVLVTPEAVLAYKEKLLTEAQQRRAARSAA